MSRGRGVASNPWKLCVVRLLFWMHFVSGVLIPFYREWGDLSYTQILALNAWFMVWNFALEVPTGAVADFWGRRVSIALGAAVAAVASLLYVSVPHLGVFLAAEVMLAAAYTLVSGADDALAYDSLRALGREAEASRLFARLESFKLAGIVLGAVAGSWVGEFLGLRAPMGLQALPALGAVFFAWTMREPAPETARDPVMSYGRVLADGVRTLARHPALRILTLDMVFTGAVAWLVIWLYQPVLEFVGVPLIWFGAVHAGMSLAQIVVLSAVPRLKSWLGGIRRVRMIAAALLAVAFALMAAAKHPPIAVAAMLVASGFGISRATLFLGELNAHIPSERRATVLSATSMARAAAIAILNPIGGWLADLSLALALSAATALALAGFVLSGWVGRRLRGWDARSHALRDNSIAASRTRRSSFSRASST